jgi:hypothetical protein
MNTPGINYAQNYLGNLTGIDSIICPLLAVSFSMTSGISYPSSLAQVTLFYQFILLHLSTLVSR